MLKTDDICIRLLSNGGIHSALYKLRAPGRATWKGVR